MNNPFLFGKTVVKNHFTDREKETKSLIANIKANLNTILVSPRRYGKSSLIKNLENKFTSNTKFVFIDIYNIRSEEEFYNQFSSKIIEATSTKFEDRIKILKAFLSSFKPSLSIDTDLGSKFEMSLNITGSANQLEEILNLPEKIAQKKNINLVIALDEFQNIEFFEDTLAFQKTCRSYWQNHRQVSYILYGSKQHMLTQMFQNRNAPFYRFGDVMYLDKIEKSYLVEFIIKRFMSTNKRIDKDTASDLVDLVKNHPYYTQQLAYILWNQSEKEANIKLLELAKETLLDQNTIFYQSDVETISNSQINFLKMVIIEEKVSSSKVLIDKYKLNSSANLVRVKKALVKKEIIEIFKTKINFYDPIFELWLKERYFNLT